MGVLAHDQRLTTGGNSWRHNWHNCKLALINPHNLSFSLPSKSFSSKIKHPLCFLKMAPNNSPEIKEPTPKIPKFHQNGVHEVSRVLLKVKKLSQNAVLPSRASSFSAGYDLSSATETKVPARGKALTLTDLSIAIP